MNYAGSIVADTSSSFTNNWDLGTNNQPGTGFQAGNQHHHTDFYKPVGWLDPNGRDLWIWNYDDNSRRIYKLKNYRESWNLSGDDPTNTLSSEFENYFHWAQAPDIGGGGLWKGVVADDTYVYYLHQHALYKYEYKAGGSSGNNTNATLIAGQYDNGYDTVDGIGANAKFYRSNSALIKMDNFIYVVDEKSLRKCDLTTGEVTTVAGNPSSTDTTYPDGIGTNAIFRGIWTGAIDHDKNFIYLHDWSSIRKFNILTNEVTTIMGSPIHNMGTVNGNATNSRYQGSDAWMAMTAEVI